MNPADFPTEYSRDPKLSHEVAMYGYMAANRKQAFDKAVTDAVETLREMADDLENRRFFRGSNETNVGIAVGVIDKVEQRRLRLADLAGYAHDADREIAAFEAAKAEWLARPAAERKAELDAERAEKEVKAAEYREKEKARVERLAGQCQACVLQEPYYYGRNPSRCTRRHKGQETVVDGITYKVCGPHKTQNEDKGRFDIRIHDSVRKERRDA